MTMLTNTITSLVTSALGSQEAARQLLTVDRGSFELGHLDGIARSYLVHPELASLLLDLKLRHLPVRGSGMWRAETVCPQQRQVLGKHGFILMVIFFLIHPFQVSRIIYNDCKRLGLILFISQVAIAPARKGELSQFFGCMAVLFQTIKASS